MAKFKVEKTKNYTTMSNRHFKDKRLSYKAKGLLSLMLSLPEEWDYSVQGLMKLSRDGKESVMSGINELEDCGYLIRTQEKDESGRFTGYDYAVYEHPFSENPSAEKPLEENPTTVNPTTVNPPQLNNNKLNTNELKTEASNNWLIKDTLPKEKSGKSAKTGPFVVNNLYVESQTRENGIPSVNQLVYPGKDSIDKSSIMSGNEAENGNSNVKTIIEYLNLKAKKSFRATTKLYERHINARLSEGYTLEDFKHVIDVKCAEWMNTDHEQYLRPDTLFAPSHFDSYLNQKIVKAKPKSAIYFSNDECREQMKNETPTF